LPLSKVAEDPELERAEQRLQEATEQHNQLLGLYTAEHPEVVQLGLRKAELAFQLSEINERLEASGSARDPRHSRRNAERGTGSAQARGRFASQVSGIVFALAASRRELQAALKAEEAATANACSHPAPSSAGPAPPAPGPISAATPDGKAFA